MGQMQVAYSHEELKAYIQKSGEPKPEGTSILGIFYHENPDPLGPLLNHSLYHHVRDILYRAGYENMQWVRIVMIEPEPVTELKMESFV